MARYEDLLVWRLSYALSQRVKSLTKKFPAHERFELTSQLRRAARSVPANLVEGSGLKGPKAFARHVRISLGSLREVEYLLLEAQSDGYITDAEYNELRADIRHVRILMFRLLRSLERASK